jgi:NTP pyrophosphatase (non-canonical NTP hydrolase)
MEEVGELARLINHLNGTKPKKPDEPAQDLEEEVGDILYTLACFANANDLDLDRAFQKSVVKSAERDAERFSRSGVSADRSQVEPPAAATYSPKFEEWWGGLTFPYGLLADNDEGSRLKALMWTAWQAGQRRKEASREDDNKNRRESFRHGDVPTGQGNRS